jgi:pheromone shutdown protein TraB
LETFLLTRTFVVALLAERNLVLADSVRKACCMETPSQKGAVVAVLGAAHVSGVARLLRTS